MFRRFILLVAAGLAAGMLLAACSGDDSDSGSGTGSGGSSGSATETAGSPAASPAATRAGSASPTGTSGSSGGIPDDLKKLAADAAKATYTATYEWGGAGMKGTMTIAQDGKNSRFHVKSDQGEFILISTEKDSFTCYKMGQTGTCRRQAPDPSLLAGFDFRGRLDDLEKEGGSLSYKKVDDRKVAGLDSYCWKTDDGTTEEATLCIAKKEKVMTFLELKGTGFFTTLTDYSGKVDSKLFEPPYPVQ